MTVAENSLRENLNFVPDSVRPLPDTFHAKTGHVLPIKESQVFKQLKRTEEYCDKNSMKINKKKTKVMVFNPCTAWDFLPELALDGQEIEMVEEMKLLGVVLRGDMKWTSNTEEMTIKAYKRLWSVRRLREIGASPEDMKDVYVKLVRSVLELAVPAWHAAITVAERKDIERVQKTAAHIMLGDAYNDYENALDFLGLESLEERRNKLCSKFAL